MPLPLFPAREHWQCPDCPAKGISFSSQQRHLSQSLACSSKAQQREKDGRARGALRRKEAERAELAARVSAARGLAPEPSPTWTDTALTAGPGPNTNGPSNIITVDPAALVAVAVLDPPQTSRPVDTRPVTVCTCSSDDCRAQLIILQSKGNYSHWPCGSTAPTLCRCPNPTTCNCIGSLSTTIGLRNCTRTASLCLRTIMGRNHSKCIRPLSPLSETPNAG